MIKISKQNIIPNKWDGGLTYEYFIFPAESKYVERNFDFRISSATIEKVPSNFTKFSGYFRYLVMLDNSLNICRKGLSEDYSKHEIFEFDSNEEIVSNSLGNDFNLMIFKRILNHELSIFEGNIIENSDWIILFALSENIIFINQIEHKLVANDCIVIENFLKNEIELSISSKVILATLNR